MVVVVVEGVACNALMMGHPGEVAFEEEEEGIVVIGSGVEAVKASVWVG